LSSYPSIVNKLVDEWAIISSPTECRRDIPSMVPMSAKERTIGGFETKLWHVALRYMAYRLLGVGTNDNPFMGLKACDYGHGFPLW